MANNFTEKANFIWTVADLIRDDFKRGKYQDVILPLTVLRRIDCVLEPTKEKVLNEHAKYKDKLKDTDKILRKASGYAFYNTSKYSFERLLDDPNNIAKNLNAYINGFSENMRDVIDHFDFRNTISKLDSANLLYLVLQRFGEIDLHPDLVDNHEMGTIFEELIRRFNEALDENPGEHFTPREVVNLMVKLLLAVENDALKIPQRVIKVADPACGTGGMLTIAKEEMLTINPKLEIYLYGQEVNPETFAVCKSDLYMKSADGKDAENIAFGSTLSKDAHPNERFDYQLANPPYGKEWKRDQVAVEAEEEKGDKGRFSAGLPRISDGQMLFLQHMLSHMSQPQDGGGRVAIVMNGSPLFTGDAGSGESEIRRWILENDWLEAIVALPEQLFYNTGIATYIWILSNHKTKERKGKAQLIDATSFWKPMRKSLGDKRREMSADDLSRITKLYQDFKEGEHSKIFANTNFGYRKITVERPLRLNFQRTEERLARLMDQTAYTNLAKSLKKDKKQRENEEKEGRQQQIKILKALETLPSTLFKDRALFEKELNQLDLSLSAPLRKAILSSLSERDETAELIPISSAKSKGTDETGQRSLPAETLIQIQKIARQVVDQSTAPSRLSLKKGVMVVISGEMEQNRMAAETIAHELKLNLYRIDLSAVVSKYIGETEKNLRRVFDAAEDGGNILFFDEADALFGKRSEVKDSHDRYANIEINYLLQQMEAYRGLIIIATNAPHKLDEALLERIPYRVSIAAPVRELEPDPDLRDTENVPLSEDIQNFFEREVVPHIPDAWINTNVRDDKDGEVGKVGYEINFNRYFYEYQPPRDLEEIEAEIKTLEKEIMEMLKEVTE